ncbi:major facilitator superfamily domain-containing protein [Lipomyces japonicus]|uniref:major facilitator superfamily domain-containing protein n=1 Tax=Lipomyces japonicus TaxID=56871 RepID=UPI0034CDAC67
MATMTTIGERKDDSTFSVPDENGPKPEYERAPAPAPTPPYSLFTGKTLTAIIGIASITSFMSSFTVTIYFPELNEIATDLGVTTELINLTVTVYFVLQGFAPVLWSSLADSIGRRPVFAMTYSIYVVANVIISVTKSFPSLMIMRMVQATGAAPSMAIAAATVADVVDRESRGSYMGFVLSMSMTAPAIAPVLSGVLSLASYGWRTAFLFMLALSVVVWAVLIVWMPETSRNVVGNGSIEPKNWYGKSVIEILRGKTWPADPDWSTLSPPKPLRNPLRILSVFAEYDILVVLFINGIFYSIYSALTVGASSDFATEYHLSTLKVGLCYLPLGCGCSIGSIVAGRILDYDYRAAVNRLGYGVTENDEFPLEQVRLKRTFWLALPFFGGLIGFGWSFKYHAHLAVVLVMMFLCGFGALSIYTGVQVLITDLYPHQSAGVNATNNLVRCWMGGAASALVEIIRDHIGVSWTYTLLALLTLLAAPLVIIEILYGREWRRTRNKKLEI